MGLCYSRSGWLSTDGSWTDCASTSNSKSLVYESPRWSAETGDKGKLAALFYRSRRRRRRQTPDLFAARLFGVMKAAHSPAGEHFAIASFVGTPFIRSLQGMDALAISAAKASARNAFLMLQEQDKTSEVEVFSPKIQIQSEDDDDGNDDEEDEEGGVELYSPEEIQVLEPDDRSDSEFSEFIELYTSDPPRSFFESCFPATGRWASVVNAAMQSACVPRNNNNYQSSPARSRHNCTEASEFSDCLEFEIRTMQQPRISAGSETCSDVGHACVGCCGSRASFGRSNSDSSEAGHGYCCGSASASSRSRTVKNETGSSSDVVQTLHQSPSSPIQEMQPESLHTQEQEPCSTIQDMEEPFVSMFTPTHGLKVNVRSMCRSPGAFLQEREPSSSATQDREEPFEIISTPTHGLKEKEEAGLSRCRISGAKLQELDQHVEKRGTGSSSTRALQEREEPFVNMCTPSHGLKREEEGLCMCRGSGARLERETGSSSYVVQMLHGQSSYSTLHVLQEMEKEEPFVGVATPTHGWKVNATRDDRVERVDSDLDAFFSFPSSPSPKVLDSGHIIEEMKSAKLMEDMGLRRILDDEPSEDEFEGPRTRAESPRSGNALSKGAFGSPFPILSTKTKPLIDKKLKLFSLDRANTAALARKREGSFDGVLTSSSESYLDTSSSSLSRPTTHDWDDYSSDLFEIHDIKAFSGVCLPLKKSFGCSVNEASSSCDGSFSDVESASSCNSSALKYQVRGANAVRGADTRAKVLREQATKKAKAERTRVQLPPEPVKPQSKGISVMVLSLLRGKQQQPPSGNKSRATNPGALPGKSVKPGLAVNYVSSFELKGKSIKALSIRDVLESQEKQNGH